MECQQMLGQLHNISMATVTVLLVTDTPQNLHIFSLVHAIGKN